MFSVYDHKFPGVSSTCFFGGKGLLHPGFSHLMSVGMPYVFYSLDLFMIFHCSLFILSMVTKFTMEIKTVEMFVSKMSPQGVLITKNFNTIFVRPHPVISWMCLTNVVLQVFLWRYTVLYNNIDQVLIL